MHLITSPRFFFLLLLASFCFSSLAFGATTPPEDEVKAVEDIAKTLGKKNWNPTFSGPGSCYDVHNTTDFVFCNCSYADGTVCHVTSLCFKRQSLPGQLPPELVKLPYLQEIDLTFNYLNGTIPKEWGSMNLVSISLGGNRLTGSIPAEIANISTLQIFVVEFNQLSGNLPPELGNLAQIQRLQLNSNNFSGELPTTLAKLTTLQEIHLGDNQFSGKIPDFIRSWTSLHTLEIQGSGLSGPIPDGISFLGNLIDLRVSDLNGYENSSFPHLSNTTMIYLILRSCRINGTLPKYIGKMTDLKTLDLSFNKLTGLLPPDYTALKTRDSYIYLTGNLLTGPIPNRWTQRVVDISYNNFSIGSPGSVTCQDEKVNLFASSLTSNDSGKVSCLRNVDCYETSYSMHINCGGNLVLVNGSTYDEDIDKAGAAIFYHTKDKQWAFSSTGYYMDNNANAFNYIASNNSELSMLSSKLYTNARISPISLTYYGFCLANGNYLVHLYFAEIMFTDDQTYGSLGRRVFDIYIQGNLVHKDFNIAKEAGGVGKPITKPFIATVINSTLEIRLYWAGKGTTGIPYKSVYGPLISAISVDYSGRRSRMISKRVVVEIVAPIVAIITILVFGVLWWKGCVAKKNSLAKDLQTSTFSLRQIKAATNDFASTNKIGEGGFGPVYKGRLSDGRTIAVKQLSSKSKQGNREFLNEIGMISALQHPCLVELYGFCVEDDQLLLVYEYLQNNSLARALFGAEQEQSIRLDWATRYKICVGIARGLAYLHEESRLKVVHRDIKATNVLLDRDLNPKISDFGLAKLDEEDNTHISTRIAGTYGYMAPEYAMHGYLTDKADVYSFGIVALEIVSGKTNTTQRQKQEAFYLLDWARLLKEKGNVMELVDIRLGSDFNEQEVMVMINVALHCTNMSPTLRPCMSSVVSMLEGETVVPETIPVSSEVLDEKKLEAMRKYYNKDESESIPMEVPLATSSTSTIDLYPVQLDSSYFQSRD